MNIVLYSGFRKRENSTKQPTGGTTFTGYLREPCSMENPTFKIERLGMDASPSTYCYAYISAFERYYFITDWTWADGLWECSCKVDPLASFKTDIAATQAYVERSSADYDTEIIDNQYPAKTKYHNAEYAVDTWYYNVSPSGGCYVLGLLSVEGSSSSLGGCVTYLVLTMSEMYNLVDYLLSDGFLTHNGYTDPVGAVEQIGAGVVKAILNPLEYITSCMWLPVSASDIGGGSTSFSLGYFEADVNTITARRLTAAVYENYALVSIPAHPQAATRGAYLNFYPYTKLTLNLPPFGTIPISPAFRQASNPEAGSYLKVHIYLDTITGKAQARVTAKATSTSEDSGAVVAEAVAQFGVQIPLAQIINKVSSGIVNGFGGAVGAVASWYSGNYAGMAMNLASIGSSVANGDSAAVRTAGLEGSYVQDVIPPVLTVQQAYIVDDNDDEIGRPLCQVKTLGDLYGYNKCGEVTIDFACTLPEKQMIEKYLMNGFFME